MSAQPTAAKAPLATGPATPSATVVLPMALQAFVVSRDFADSAYRVAPLLQPDYAALRTEAGLVRHDMMERLNLSASRLKARFNTRFVDVTTGKWRPDRVGVYLSWCLPRAFRAGMVATRSAASGARDARIRAGYNADTSSADESDIQFRPVPDRWLVVRYVHSGSNVQPAAFVVESNRVRSINDPDLSSKNRPDVENITSPYVDPSLPLERQSSVYIGRSDSLKAYQPGPSEVYRRPFTILESGNEFFADYQPHNVGVFSLFDDVDQPMGDPSTNRPCTLSYLVVGFHSQGRDDPLAVVDVLGENAVPLANSHLLHACGMALEPGHPFLSQIAGPTGRTLCHGVLRNVPFDRFVCKLTAPSLKLQQLVQTAHPIAVGTHALDALAAYLHVEQASRTDSVAVEQLLGQLVMLIVRDDDVEGQRKAADEISTNDWNAHSEGTVWQLPKHEDPRVGNQQPSGGEPEPAPPDTHRLRLDALNGWQQRLDTCTREHAQLRQRLFRCWWNLVAFRSRSSDVLAVRRAAVKSEATAVAQRLQVLDHAMASTSDTIAKLQTELEKLTGPLASSSSHMFGIHQDPTLLLAGVPSGWPAGFADAVRVRMASDIAPNVDKGKVASKIGMTDWESQLGSKFGDVAAPVTALLREFSEDDQSKRNWAASAYASMEDLTSQGWFPLYLEWEVEYYHIPWEHWEFRPSSTGSWQYGIRKGTVLSNTTSGADRRILHGRTLITPQSGATLRARLEQLFKQTGKAQLDRSISEADRAAILRDVVNLEFFSSPLGGFTDHLVTLRRGTHPRPPPSDEQLLKDVGLKAEHFKLLASTGASAPYGITTPLEPAESAFSPFKPVTHGQVRFTKVTIVDKFGQVVTAIEPAQADGTPASALYPCISPRLACEPVPGTFFPNTVVKADAEEGLCQFFQLPPRVNQEIRLNAAYLVPGEKRRAATEWDNPVWGWLLANYLNDSIHVFNPDGGFVCEVLLLRTSSSTSVSVRPGRGYAHAPIGRLEVLVAALRAYPFAQSLFTMLGDAVRSIDSTSADFDASLPAVFGQPFCLVDIGLSLELAAPPLRNQSLLSPLTPLVREPELVDYEFSVAVGNAMAAFDGLVGTFSADSATIEQIFTGYGLPASSDRPSGSVLAPMTKPLSLRPYFSPGDHPDLANEHMNSMRRLSAIVDPICPVHIYSGSLLPPTQLSLPKWTTEAAMRSLQTFFAVGPLLVPPMPAADVVQIQGEASAPIPILTSPASNAAASITPAPAPHPDPTTAASAVSGQVPVPAEMKLPSVPTVKMPLSGLERWEWLQPRLDEQELVWDKLHVGAVDEHLKVEASAATELVEGYAMIGRQQQKVQ